MAVQKKVAAHLRHGSTLMKRNQHDGAMRCYEKAIAADPKCIEAYDGKGAILRIKGQYTEALACLDQAVNLLRGMKSATSHAAIYTNRAKALEALGRRDKAQDDRETARRLLNETGGQRSMDGEPVSDTHRTTGEPDSPYARKVSRKVYESALEYHRQGVSLAAEGKNSEAAECFQHATILDPNLVEAYYSRGTVMRRMGRGQDALDCFDQAIKANPKYALAYHDKSVELRRMGMHKEAMECLDTAILLDPNLGMAVFGKGSLLLEMGRPKEAIPYFDRALEIDPGEPIIYKEKGEALVRTGDRRGARKCFRRAKGMNLGGNSAPWV